MTGNAFLFIPPTADDACPIYDGDVPREQEDNQRKEQSTIRHILAVQVLNFRAEVLPLCRLMCGRPVAFRRRHPNKSGL
jgi:hypothetical protein